jgi:excisionase family DNA binding protein
MIAVETGIRDASLRLESLPLLRCELHPLQGRRPDILLGVEEAAPRRCVSRDTLRRLLRQKKPAGLRGGGQWRLPAIEIAALFLSRSTWEKRSGRRSAESMKHERRQATNAQRGA